MTSNHPQQSSLNLYPSSSLPPSSSSIPLPSSTAVADDDDSNKIVEDFHDEEEEDHNRGEVIETLLIVGPAGSGKSNELIARTMISMWNNLGYVDRDVPLQVLCLSPYHTSLAGFTQRMKETMETFRQEEARQREKNRETMHRPSMIPNPVCSTIHHICRKWIATYGHLINLPNIAEVCTRERTTRILETLQSAPLIDEYDIDNVGDWQESIRRIQETLAEDLTIAIPNIAYLDAAVRAAVHCVKQLKMGAVALEDFIRLYKINNFTVTDEMRERIIDEERIDAANEVREYYDGLLRHNRLYDFEDLVIFGDRLVQEQAHHIIKAEKIGLIVLDDLQNTYEQQRHFIKALTSSQGTNGRLITACHDYELAHVDEGEPDDIDRSVFKFTGADTLARPEELMHQVISPLVEFDRIDLHQNQRSPIAIQKVAYGLFNRHLINAPPENIGEFPTLKAVKNIPKDAAYILQRSEEIQVEDVLKDRLPSSITIVTRTNANVRFLVDALTRLYAPIRVMGIENNDICSNEAIDLLSFFGTIQDPSLHHLFQRSVGIFAICKDFPTLSFEQFPEPDIVRDYIVFSDEGFELDRRAIQIPEDQKQYLDLLSALRGILKRTGNIRGAVDFLLSNLQYKERILRTRLAPDGSPSPPRQMNWDDNLPDRTSDYAGARWENVQIFLIRISDFDRRLADEEVEFENPMDKLDLLLRECHAYAPDRLAYIRRNPDREITLSTMHYAIGAEYDVVFVNGVEEGSIPGEMCRGATEIRQEKTLLHLISLCAKRELYYTYLSAFTDDEDGAEGDNGGEGGNRRRRRIWSPEDLDQLSVSTPASESFIVAGYSPFLEPVIGLLRHA